MTNAPILDEVELLAALRRERANGKTIAFANGIFDLLHVGHVRYLQAAAREGDVLVVGVNSDASTKLLKGEGRPLMQESERAEIVSAIRGVGYVTIFGDKSPATLITKIQPDVHCKGTDYTVDTVPERDTVISYGGRIAIVGDPKDHSTRDLLSRIRQ
jgi:rfaE bifunctional protein nucleotidyltransferase chain/domain